MFRDPFADPFGSKHDTGASDGRPRGAPALPPQKKPRDGRVPGEMGIWAFVFFDLWWFSFLFGVTVYTRGQHPEVFNDSRHQLTLWEGTLNTLLLLTASLLVVKAMHNIRASRPEVARRLAGFAMLCALAFLVNKAVEWTHLLSDDHTPSQNDFFLFFFLLTGVHALHLIAGTFGLAYMRRVFARPQIDRKGHRNLEVVATYWHLVDLLWVVIFAIFYLMR